MQLLFYSIRIFLSNLIPARILLILYYFSSFCSAGLLEFKYALDLTRYLEKETNYIAWDAGYSSLSSLTTTLPKAGKIYQRLRVSFPKWHEIKDIAMGLR